MFKAGTVGSGIGGTCVRFRSPIEGVEDNVLRDVKPDTVIFLKAPGK